MVRKSVTQKLEYGCGVACFAFICDVTFEEAVVFLGKEYSVRHGWRPSDLVRALNRFGLNYKNCYIRNKDYTYFPVGSMVLLERSWLYPVGHYLVFTDNGWMDPWINMPINKDIKLAESGFRDALPGRPMYVLLSQLTRLE